MMPHIWNEREKSGEKKNRGFQKPRGSGVTDIVCYGHFREWQTCSGVRLWSYLFKFVNVLLKKITKLYTFSRWILWLMSHIPLWKSVQSELLKRGQKTPQQWSNDPARTFSYFNVQAASPLRLAWGTKFLRHGGPWNSPVILSSNHFMWC